MILDIDKRDRGYWLLEVLIGLAICAVASVVHCAEIVGPDKVEPCRKAAFEIQMPGTAKAIHRISPPTDSVITGHTIYVWAKPGTYTLDVMVSIVDFENKIHEFEMVSKQFIIEGKSPDPDPDPGPTPGPDPPTPDNPSPFPEEGFRVLVLFESADKANYPRSQLAIIEGKTARDYLESHCVTEADGKTKAYRIWDKDTPTDADLPVWKNAMQRRPQSIPWVMIGNGKTGYEGPLPETVEEFVAKCEEFLK